MIDICRLQYSADFGNVLVGVGNKDPGGGGRVW
jgi:hypothetical protein